MPEMLDILETIRTEEASVHRIFDGEGRGVRTGRVRGADAQYMQKLAEAAKFVQEILSGRRPAYHLQEAMTTADFPQLFGDILDRQVLANYREAPQVYRAFTKVETVRDFRFVKRFPYAAGGGARLDLVPEQKNYPVRAVADSTPYQYHVHKYGSKMPFSWETIINDDLDMLKDVPERFGRAARATESHFATSLYVDANGPAAAFYNAGNRNVVTVAAGALLNNPVLSLPGLQDALRLLALKTDADGNPIVLSMVHLVVGPALMITAQNILNALQLELTTDGGDANRRLIALNWMKNKVQLHVEPWIPIVANVANADTSWWLFADVNDGPPAIVMGFLRGHEEPEMFMKSPNAVRVGGGTVDPMQGDFDTDSLEYKVRHVLGGTTMDPNMTVASNGTGAP